MLIIGHFFIFYDNLTLNNILTSNKTFWRIKTSYKSIEVKYLVILIQIQASKSLSRVSCPSTTSFLDSNLRVSYISFIIIFMVCLLYNIKTRTYINTIFAPLSRAAHFTSHSKKKRREKTSFLALCLWREKIFYDRHRICWVCKVK